MIAFLASACGGMGEAAGPPSTVAGKYASAQELSAAIVANGMDCKFVSRNTDNTPIYDKGGCYFQTDKDKDTYAIGVNLTVELMVGQYGVADEQVRAAREAYWNTVRESSASLGQTEFLLLAGPNWYIHGNRLALTEAQKALGGDILDAFSEPDREVFINR
jgi:hypothetical protein